MINRQKWIDEARGIALLLVVIGHMGIPYVGQFFTTVHLPLFFFLSGLTFSAKRDFGTFLKGKAKRLMIPYVCLGIPLLLFSFATHAIQGAADPAVYWDLFLKFLIQQRMYTIWFLPCLVIASILLYGIVKLAKDRGGWVLGICAVLGIAGLGYWELGGKELPWNVDAAFVAVMFMGMGYRAGKTDWIYKERNFKSWIWFFCAAVIYVGCVALNGFFIGEKFDMASCWGGCIPVSLVGIAAGIYCIVFFTKHIHIGIFNYLGRNTMVYFAWHQSIVLPLLLGFYNWAGWFTANTILLDAVRSLLTVVLIFLVLWPIDLLFRKTKLRITLGK